MYGESEITVSRTLQWLRSCPASGLLIPAAVPNDPRARMLLKTILPAIWAVTLSAAPGRAQEPAHPDSDRKTSVAECASKSSVVRGRVGRRSHFRSPAELHDGRTRNHGLGVTTSESFRLAALSSFDPYVFPFVGSSGGGGQTPRAARLAVG